MIIFLMSALLFGCAKNSGIVPYGGDSFMVSRQAPTGFHGMGNLKAEALQEANAHCASSGQEIEVIKEVDAKPPYIMGNFPRTEVHFKCVQPTI